MPISVKLARVAPETVAVVAAAPMSVLKAMELLLNSVIRYGSPCTHGYSMVRTAVPRRGISELGATVKGQMPPLTLSWLMVTSSALALRMCSSITPGRNTLRSNWIASLGAAGWTLRPAPPVEAKRAMTPARSSTGTSRTISRRSLGMCSRSVAGFRRTPVATLVLPSAHSSRPHIEDAGPAQLGELRLVRVEHVPARMPVGEFQNSPLSLHQGDGVRVLRCGPARAGWVVVKEVGVEMERVDGVELEQVDQKDPHQLANPDLDGVPVVVEVEGDRVDRVELVLVIEVDVDAVHHHDELVVRLRPAVPGGDDEPDPDAVALAHPEARPRHSTVVQPDGEPDPGHHFDRLLLRHHAVLAERLAAGQSADSARVEVGEDVGRVEPVADMVHLAPHGRHGEGAIRAVGSMAVVPRACGACRNGGSEPAAQGSHDSGAGQTSTAEAQPQGVTAGRVRARLLLDVLRARHWTRPRRSRHA